MKTFALVIVLSALLPVQHVAAQYCPGWTPVNLLPRSDFAMAYDSQRHVAVIFGGTSTAGKVSDTREWDGQHWIVRVATGPRYQPGARMVFDASRHVCVLQNWGETWEWNGQAWTFRTNLGPDRQLGGFAMAYDAARQQTVLFGGYGRIAGTYDYDYLPQTWTWDGQSWQVAANTGPVGRSGHAMAYDPVRQRVVLFGGRGATSYADTWEWNGALWTQRATTGPRSREDAAMAYSSAIGRIILMGGVMNGGFDTTLWRWDGTTWTASPVTGCPARSAFGMVEDTAHNSILCFGGWNGVTTLGDTREINLNGSAAVGTLRDDSPAPAPRRGAACAYDSTRHVMVMFGGTLFVNGSQYQSNETWEWDGERWSLRSASGPSPRSSACMAFDRDRGVIVLYGGYGGPGVGSLLDTWEWNGSTWTQRASLTLLGTGNMVYDEARHVTLFYGSVAPNSIPSNGATWTWDGAAWTRVSQYGLSPREFFAMAYDSDRQTVVIHGGYNQTTTFSDTWEWNGIAWLPVQASSLFARYFHSAVYDRAIHAMISVDGFAYQTPYFGNVWIRDGAATQWAQAAQGNQIERCDYSMVYDDSRDVIIRFGGTGQSYNDVRNDTLILDLHSPPAITSSPQSWPAALGSSMGFSVEYISAQPPTYQWRHNGIALQDGGNISGAQSINLSINPVTSSDAGEYDVIVSNPCGSATSDSATLTVYQRGDATGDGHVNVSDLLAVVTSWGACPPVPSACPADMAPPPQFGDRMIDVNDLLVVILNWGA